MKVAVVFLVVVIAAAYGQYFWCPDSLDHLKECKGKKNYLSPVCVIDKLKNPQDEGYYSYICRYCDSKKAVCFGHYNATELEVCEWRKIPFNCVDQEKKS